jgi:hypothetical protein
MCISSNLHQPMMRCRNPAERQSPVVNQTDSPTSRQCLLMAHGILTIAVEWRHRFERDVCMRQKRIERDFKKSEAESRGEKFDEDEDDLEYTMWRPF